LERRADADVDVAAGELSRRVLAEPTRDLGENLRRRVHEHPVLARLAERRVVAERVAYEVGQLGERLDARVPGADEDERELALAVRLVRRGRRGFEAAQDVVAEIDRVGERLEAAAVVGQAGDRQRPRDGAERDHEVGVAQVDEALAGLDLDALPLRVVRDRAAEDEVGVRAHHPERDDDVPRLEGARRRLGQHRRIEHEVLRRDDCGAALAEQPRDVAAGEAAAEDERAAERVA
jgi:hypothetical protein